MLRSAGSFTENEQGVVTFPEISAAVLERVCQYFYYKLRYQNTYVHSTATATDPLLLPSLADRICLQTNQTDPRLPATSRPGACLAESSQLLGHIEGFPLCFAFIQFQRNQHLTRWSRCC